MTFEEINKNAYDLTQSEVKKVRSQMVDDYNRALKDINKQIRKVYNETLSGVAPERYFAVMTKYNRLKNLRDSIQKAYMKSARDAGRKIEAAAKLAISNLYYRHMYALNWSAEAQDVFVVLNEKVIQVSVYGTPEIWQEIRERKLREIERVFGELREYQPQSGTLLEELIKKRRPQVLSDIESNIRQGLIKGEGVQKVSRRIRDVMGTDINNAERIVRTESHRNMLAGNFAMTEAARSEGVDVRREIASVLDDRTRRQSAQVDGLKENEEGYFIYPGGVRVRIPGNSGIARYDVNDRESVVNRVPGIEPNTRRARDPVTGENEIISFKSFDEWAKSKGLRRNRYGEIIRPD